MSNRSNMSNATNAPIIIPDEAVDKAFGTHEWTEVGLGSSFPVKAQFDPESLPVPPTQLTCSLQDIQWAYSGEGGVTQGEMPDPNATGGWKVISSSFSPDGKMSLKMAAPYQPSGCVLQINAGAGVDANTVWTQYFLARSPMPLWTSLPASVQDILLAVKNSLQLLHDNSYGNSKPNLAEFLQVHYSLETIAEAAKIALLVWQGEIIQPTSYSLSTLPGSYYGLLYVASLRELVHRIYLGYLETPELHGDPGVPYPDRKQYFDRWKGEYDKLSEQYKTLLSIYEREQLDLCGASLLLGGGYFRQAGAMIKNQELQAMQNGVIEQQFFPVVMEYAPGPVQTY